MTVHFSHGCPVTAGANWLFGWADTIPAFSPKILFYDPVFKRVEGNDCQPPARRQSLDCKRKDFLDRFQLPVYGNSQALKGAGSRMVVLVTPSGGLANDFGKL